MTTKEILTFLTDHKAYLRDRFAVRRIGLFGSYARGEVSKESDIDVIVDMPSSFDGYYSLKEYLEEHLKKPVDLGLESNIRAFIKEKIQDEIIYV